MAGIHLYKRNKIWWFSFTDPNGIRIQKSTRTSNRKTAQLVVSDLAIKLDRQLAGLELPKELTEISLQDFYDKLVDQIETRKTNRTAITYKLHLDNFYKYLRETSCKNVSDISINIINDFISSRLISGTHNNTINHELDTMRTLFNIAMDLKLVEKNPFVKLRAIRPPKIKRPPRYFSTEELERIFKVITPRFRPYFLTLLFTGVRSGELELFEWDDFDLENRIVKVRTKKISERKMRSRNIPMHYKVKEAYLKRKKLFESERYVFTTKSGNPIGVQMLRKQFKKFLGRAGVSGSTHVLRHTFASHFISKTGDIYYLSKLLGHTSIVQTEIYAHLLPTKDFKIIENSLNFDI